MDAAGRLHNFVGRKLPAEFPIGSQAMAIDRASGPARWEPVILSSDGFRQVLAKESVSTLFPRAPTMKQLEQKLTFVSLKSRGRPRQRNRVARSIPFLLRVDVSSTATTSCFRISADKPMVERQNGPSRTFWALDFVGCESVVELHAELPTGS
jgi:hypothetical protein